MPPSPPPANYPAMGTRVGYSDGQVLTTAELNQIAAYLVAQDGNGTEQEMWCRPVGTGGYLVGDPAGAVWLSFNGFYDQGTSAWWAANTTIASYAIKLTSAGINFYQCPANTSPFAWTEVDTLGAGGLAGLLALQAALAAETTRAETEEAALQSGINVNTANIATNAAAIAGEIARAEGEEAGLQAQISAEVSRAEGAEAALSSEIGAINSAMHFFAGGFVSAATTAALPANTYANGSAGVGATLTGNSNGALSAIDGVSPTVGMRLLVKNESAAANNGVYTITQVGGGSVPYILTRATDANTPAGLGGGNAAVSGGATNAGDVFLLALSAAAITIGTTALNFILSSLTIPPLDPLATKAAAYTVQAGDKVVRFGSPGSPLTGNVICTIPLALGSSSSQRTYVIEKGDTSAHTVSISPDGTTIIDVIMRPATSGGQVNGWREVYSDGTVLQSRGVG